MLTASVRAGAAVGSPGPASASGQSCQFAIVDQPWQATLHDIVAISATDVWAVGGQWGDTKTFATHWDGSAWTIVPTPSPGNGNENPLLSVAASGSNDVWAVGFQYVKDAGYTDYHNVALVEHWDGAAWSVVPVPPTRAGFNSYLTGVSVTSPSDAWAVGYVQEATNTSHPLAEHWDGTAWTEVRMPIKQLGSSVRMQGVASVASDDVWAVGAIMVDVVPYQTVRMHWDGRRWRSVRGPNDFRYGTTLYDVAVVSPSDVWAVGTTGDPGEIILQSRTEHWDGTRWTKVDAPNGPYDATTLAGVSADASADVWAVGASWPQGGEEVMVTVVDRWDGSQWSSVPGVNPNDINGFLGVAALSSTDVFAVGLTGALTTDGLVERYSC
jgi:hypothetical protein